MNLEIQTPPNRPARVGILGTPMCSGNRGVIALAESLIRLCRQAAPGAEVFLFGSDRTGKPVTVRPDGAPLQVPIVRWRLSPRGGHCEHLFWITAMSLLYRLLPPLRTRIAKATPWIAALESMDFVGDVRGGDSFSDIYGLRRFLIATLPTWSVILVKGSVVQFPQTYGPYASSLARGIAAYLLRRSSCVIARDTQSRKVAVDLLRGSKDVLLSPDVAFALHVRPPDGPLQTEPQMVGNFPARAIGLNVNGLMFSGGYTGRNMFGLRFDYRNFVIELAAALLKHHDGELVLIPHTFAPAGNPESDNHACRQVLEALPEELRMRTRAVVSEYDAHEIKHVIGRCDFFIGSRMHSCIAALSQGIPCVAVAYSMKFSGVFESVGMADWVIDAREVEASAAIAKVIELFSKRDSVRHDLGIQAAKAVSDLNVVFRRLMATGYRLPGYAGADTSPNSIDNRNKRLTSAEN